MKNALKKSAYREIRSTKSRFLSIFGIVAIGVGFFSGVKAAAPDMRYTADTYFDESSLMDFRLVSTYGFDEKDISALEALPGAEVTPSYYTDVIAVINEGSPAAARVFSIGGGEVNKLTLLEGRMPEAPGECLAVGTGMKNMIDLGSTVVFSDGDGGEPSDMLDRFSYTVTGIVVTPLYIDKSSFGSTSVGNGSISNVFYLPGENFCVEYNTEVYIRFPETMGFVAYEDEYNDRIDLLKGQVEEVARRREKERFSEIKNEADEKISDAKKELADAENEANEKIADGERELADAKQKLDDAETEIADGEKEIADGEKELADARKKLDDALAELTDARKRLDDGYIELDEARREFDEQVADAREKLSEAKKELEENERKLADGEEEYNDGLKLYEENLEKYNDGLEKYNDGLKEYEAGLAEWNENREKLEAAREKLESAKAELRANELTLNESKSQLDAAQAQLEQLKLYLGEDSPQYIAAKEQYDSGLAQYNSGLAQLTAAEKKLAESERELEEGEKQLADGKETLDAAKATLESTEKQLSSGKLMLDSAKKKLDDAKAEIEDGKKQLADGKKAYEDAAAELDEKTAEAERKFADAEKELADGERDYSDGEKEYYDGEKEYSDGAAELSDAKKKLADGKADYEQGLIDYADGEKELNDGKAEADEKISDAKKELADAEEKIADLEEPEWYVFTRNDNAGYSEYGENSERINNIASVFPVFFILVAILVCLTTMSRMVDEQRIQIGTLKALGYSNGKIIYKYMLYAAAATASGAIFGGVAGMKLFPSVIITAYGIMYAIPRLVMPLDLATGLISFGVSMAAITGTVFACCHSALNEQAAQLMRPKPPKNGKRILLEHIGIIWKHFNFSSKVTARNLFRYKRKMLMSTIGIAGCTALLLTGFSLYDSINDVIIKQYEELQSYDGIAVYDAKKHPGSDAAAARIIAGFSEESGSVNVFQKQMEVDNGGRSVSAYVAVPQQAEIFTGFLNLRDRETGKKYQLTDGAVYIDEKMSLLLGAKAGDTLTISESDTKKVRVTLTAAFENYPNHYVYMTEKTYTELFGEKPEYNTVYFRHGLPAEDEDRAAEQILSVDGVVAVTLSSDVKETFAQMLKALDLVIIVIIISAGILAFIVMYNLTNININERIREIATLKVLGFYDMEVDAYIFRENILLTLLGTAAGLVLGVFLAQFIITTAEVDLVMFGRNIYAMSYILAGVITLVFSLMVTFVMHGRLKNVNMIEALKSVE